MSFGLNPAEVLAPDAVPRLWWGARAIYNPSAKFAAQLVELLPDRQQFNDYTDRRACQSLASWINRKGLGKLRKELRLNFIARDEAKLLWVRDGAFNLIANPKASHGYLYLAAWRTEECLPPKEKTDASSSASRPR